MTADWETMNQAEKLEHLHAEISKLSEKIGRSFTNVQSVAMAVDQNCSQLQEVAKSVEALEHTVKSLS